MMSLLMSWAVGFMIFVGLMAVSHSIDGVVKAIRENRRGGG